ncbi:MAG: 16S rRNA (adenine(1518)-N(6)/adenine(1519)-N(6))-dimethyltransferase RsmA [Kiritimatiellae bacterium]|nr:16S rRNA (adenine(1518)-N(6)/adenine(1519)-N(6))-dimethyltransferase RsmA [Kiritimatiellia bacterium]
MHLTRPSEVKAWCQQQDFHPNRTLGQNFLIDRNILDAIVASAELTPGAAVLEVGPGLGVVTEALLGAGARVTAVEKDRRLAAWLRETFGAHERLALIEADMLDLDLDRLLTDGGAAPSGADLHEPPVRPPAAPAYFAACVSNLPYSAGTRILLELTRHPLSPPLIAVTVQHEVAERLAAPPGAAARGLAGVWVQRRYDVELLREIKSSCFWPRPEVGSSLVRLRQHARLPLTETERDVFERLTRHVFMHRRKQMLALMRAACAELGLPDVDAAACLEAAGLPGRIRPEELTTAQWQLLACRLAGQR